MPTLNASVPQHRLAVPRDPRDRPVATRIRGWLSIAGFVCAILARAAVSDVLDLARGGVARRRSARVAAGRED